ncbi:hypothetical protein SLEP1_g10508 [Rubroshorea leprosula]|uniref:Uncharacterized protein n=1 Tax=Rubroshorea leprosula TaxID=152421 RepID=A0AAV5IE68_9ROSI|nr:hypothetical protein SLEP1_g10508 [Rubroshorea leprosula]
MEIAKPVNNGVRLFKCNFPSTHHPLAPSFQVILVGADENLNPVCPKILKMVRHRGNAIKVKISSYLACPSSHLPKLLVVDDYEGEGGGHRFCSDVRTRTQVNVILL